MKLLPSLVALLLISLPAGAAVVETDILVFGGTAAGVSAACTAAQLGKSAAVTEYGRHLGGLTSGGLGWTDIGNKAAIGGFGHEFYKRLGVFYGKDEAWTFEPHVAEAELRAQLLKANVKAYFNQRLASVKKEGTRIVEITMEDGSVYRAKVFIDCSYEGDLMAKAGVKYMVGREANAQFGEEINGIREKTPQHQFGVEVDPYVKPGDPKSGLLPFVQPDPLGTPGAGDKSVQAYNFRLCFTKKEENKRPIDPPPGYDPKQFELLGRYFQALAAANKMPGLRAFLKIDMVTPDKTDINNNGAFSTDYIGFNYAYPDADYATRDKIWKDHENYIRGLVTFIATDSRVPENLRNEMKSWGLCKDEFQDTGGWPHQMYVREARRMIGEYVMSEKNCRWTEKVEDSVGLGAYNMDSHNCRRIVVNGFVRNEGDVQVGVRGPYPVSYRSLVPKAAECENLLVPVCLSATHIAYGSIRMEPVFMIMGQSAATAASIAIDEVVSVQKVPYERLKARLLEDKQILEWTGAARPAPRASGPPPKLEGIVLDDADAKKVGDWESGSQVQDRQVGAGYIHDGNAKKGELALRWTVDVAEAGEYEIIFRFPVNGNRATNVPLVVDVAGKPTALRVDQRDPGSKGAVSLGKYILPHGPKTTVTLSTEGTNGFVVADGLQVVKK
jgi:hypothetical protein